MQGEFLHLLWIWRGRGTNSRISTKSMNLRRKRWIGTPQFPNISRAQVELQYDDYEALHIMMGRAEKIAGNKIRDDASLFKSLQLQSCVKKA